MSARAAAAAGIVVSVLCSRVFGGEAAAPKNAVELRIYDMRAALAVHRDYAPQWDFTNRLQCVSIGVEEVDAADFAKLITDQICPGTWDAASGTSIEERSGRLLVTHRPAVHRAIQDLVAHFEKRNMQQVSVDALAATAKAAPGNNMLTDNEVDELLGAGRRQTAMRVIAYDRQLVTQTDARLASYVAGLTWTEQAVQPNLALATGGVCLMVRPAFVRGQESALVDFGYWASDDPAITRQPAAAVGGAGKEAAPESFSLDAWSVRASVAMPFDRWVVVDVAMNPGPDAAEKPYRLLLASARPYGARYTAKDDEIYDLKCRCLKAGVEPWPDNPRVRSTAISMLRASSGERAGRTAALIKDLDDDAFTVRDAASRRLAEDFPLNEKPLRAALADKAVSPEAAWRLKAILDTWQPQLVELVTLTGLLDDAQWLADEMGRCSPKDCKVLAGRLRKVTGKSFGDDPAAWMKFLKERKAAGGN
jgi:hypothetical protein